jgi:hypothetical protein
MSASYRSVTAHVHEASTVEPGYNNIGLSETSSIPSDILWYQLIPHCKP